MKKPHSKTKAVMTSRSKVDSCIYLHDFYMYYIIGYQDFTTQQCPKLPSNFTIHILYLTNTLNDSSKEHANIIKIVVTLV